LSELAQQEFFRSLHGSSGAGAVALAKEKLANFEEHRQEYAEGGKYMPLSYWTRKGLDARATETLSVPSDVMDHRILGTCYRVAVLYKGEAGHKGQARSSEAESTRPPMKAAAAASVAVKAVIDDSCSESESSSDNRSTNSSSSSRKKKSRKSKKTNKTFQKCQ
jgi:hypothetical protein